MTQNQGDMRGNLISRVREVMHLPDNMRIPNFILDEAKHQLEEGLESEFTTLLFTIMEEHRVKNN